MKLIITETLLDDEQLINAISNAIFDEFTSQENRSKFKEWSYDYLDVVVNKIANNIMKDFEDIFSVKQNNWKSK